MFDITIQADTPVELASKIKALAALMSGAPFAEAADMPAETAPDATIAAPKVKAVKAKPEPEPEPVEAPALLDFNTEVAPTVIRIVESHGKPLVASVLEQFGVAKASEMEPALWPELLVALEAAAEAA
jgi:hypothetical protein